MQLLNTKIKNQTTLKEKNKKLYTLFFKRLLKDKIKIILIGVLMFFTALLYVAIPFILKEGIQKLYFIQTFHYVLIAGVVFIILYAVLSILKEKLVVSYSLTFIADLKKDLFKGVLRKTINKFQFIGGGNILAFLSYNVSLIRSLIEDWGAVFIQQMLNFIALFAASFFIDARLSVLFFILMPVFVVYAFIIQYIVRNFALELNTLNKNIFQNAYDTLSDFTNLKINIQEEKRLFSFSKLIDKDRDIRIKRTLIYQYNKVILHAISLLLIVVFVLIGGQMLNMQEMVFSEFIFFVLYIHLLFRPFEVALQMSSFFEAGKIGIKSVFRFISDNDFSELKNIHFKGGINIENLTYKNTRSRFRLAKINLDIKAGEKITIIGNSSSGKSQFLQMLLHFRKPQKGYISFDGLKAEELGIRTIRKNISVVSKDYFLGNMTVSNYLSSGDPAKLFKNQNRLINFCQELKLLEKIIQIDGKKMQTRLNKEDFRFSETEKIKLALVRACMQNNSIVVFDNFWHFFDEETLGEVKAFVKKHFNQKTIIQLSTKSDNLLIEPDRTLNLVNGKFV